jgi:hypothetical protein
MTDPRIRVVATSTSYRAAVAQLPMTVELSDDPAGAVAVVEGGDAWADAARAEDRGAVALVLHDPPIGGVRHRPAVPVVVCRPFVPPTIAGPPPEPPHLLTVEVAVTSEDSGRWIRDALGWARILAGGNLHLSGGAGTGRSALLSAPGGVPVLLSVSPTAGAAVFRVTARGASTVEVVADSGSGVVVRSTSSADGTTSLPARLEDPRRAALRDACAALRGEPVARGWDECRADTDLAAAVVARGIDPSDAGHSQTPVPGYVGIRQK